MLCSRIKQVTDLGKNIVDSVKARLLLTIDCKSAMVNISNDIETPIHMGCERSSMKFINILSSWGETNCSKSKTNLYKAPAKNGHLNVCASGQRRDGWSFFSSALVCRSVS